MILRSALFDFGKSERKFATDSLDNARSLTRSNSLPSKQMALDMVAVADGRLMAVSILDDFLSAYAGHDELNLFMIMAWIGDELAELDGLRGYSGYSEAHCDGREAFFGDLLAFLAGYCMSEEEAHNVDGNAR